MRKIRTGVRLYGSIEALEGIRPGERVIVEGLQKVVPGAPVRIAPAGGSVQEKPVATAQKGS